MDIKINNCRIVKADDLNISVQQYRLIPQSKNPKFRHDGEKYDWIHIGYYTTIKQALKKVIDSELFECQASSIQDIINKIDDLYDKIDKLNFEKSS